jgi:hypothetical protein
MARVIPTQNFDGYPDGKTRTFYQEGVEVTVPEQYAKLLVDVKKMATRAPKSPDDV